jgi:TetR/AcrR family transcriptional regulator, transcriptional repressor of bet genes
MHSHWKRWVMPKKIDHEQRRRELAHALWRVLVAHGMEAVSLRQVAAEAGVSMGMVQHYFADKEEMVLFALSSMTEQFGRRVGDMFAALSDPDDPLSRVRAVLVAGLPLDDERRVEAQVGVTFLAHAPVIPSIAEYLRSGYAEGHAYLTEQLRAAGIDDPEREASTLFALSDGLAAHTLAGHHEPAEALAVLDAHLAALRFTYRVQE